MAVVTETEVSWREKELLTLAEAAEVLRMSRSGVHGLAQQGRIPGAFQIGQDWRVSVRRFSEWIDCVQPKD